MSEDYGVVSIIVPVYNVEKYFDECIDSLLHQTYENIEIIIVDDGSTDECGKKADDYEKKDCRIVVFHQENKGLPYARNLALKHTTGDYYCFVDSDDVLDRRYVEKMLKTLVDKDADMVFCNYFNCYVNKNRPSSKLLRYTEERYFSGEEYLRDMYVYTGAFSIVWNKIFRKEIFNNLEFVNMICEDSQIMLSIIDRCKKIYYLPEILYYYRRRKHSLINGKQELILQSNMIWIDEHMRRLKESNRDNLFSIAQKLFISKILEKYCFCGREMRKRVKERLREEERRFIKNRFWGKKIKTKYYIATRVPYLYGKYSSLAKRDNNIFWE